MAMERPQYARIESEHESTPASVSTSPPTSVTTPPPSPGAPPRGTLRHKVSRAFNTLTRRDPSSPDRERGPTPPLPTPTTPPPYSTATASQTETAAAKEKERQNPLKRTWGRSVAMARTRSEPALRAKRAKAAAIALAPPAKASRSAPQPVTTHSRDVNAYVPAEREGAVVSYTYPLWRIDPVLVGCFVCL